MPEIFCNNNHLVLDHDYCRFCSWTRPVTTGGGEARWENTLLPGEIGRTGVVRPAVCRDVIVFPLTNGMLVGLSIQDGSLLWTTPLEADRLVQGIHPFGNRFLCAISDVRLVAPDVSAQLAFLDPQSGEMSSWWRSDSGRISDFTRSGDRIYLKTARPALLEIETGESPKVHWEFPLQSWSAMAPVLVGDRVMVMDADMASASGNIRFVRTSDGQGQIHPYYTATVQMQPVTVIEGRAFFQNGGRRFTALEPDTAEPLWEIEYERIYTAAAAGSGCLYLVVRWKPPEGSGHEYRLAAVDAATGETCWETTLNERTTMPPAFHHNRVFVGTEKGSICAFDGTTGKMLWHYRFPGGTESVQTSLEIHSGAVFAATRSGQIAAVSLGVEDEPPGDPQALYDAGRFEQAAAAYALQGDFATAARVYNEKLRSPEKALALLEHAGLNREAGQLAQELQLNTLALNFFRSAGDVHAEALVLMRMGNSLKAAQILEEIGELDQAAKLYEKAQEPRKALEIYKKMAQFTQVARLSDLVTGTDEDIAFLEQAGRLKDAARIAEKNGRFHKAVDLFFKAKAVEEEYRVLKTLLEENPEEWSLERLGQLASSFQDHHVAARVWDLLERPRQAALAYCAAAEQAEKQSQPADEIAALYEQAMQRFGEAGLHKERKACSEKIIQLRGLPYIVVRARMDDRFREEEFNEVTLEVENAGPGLALDVAVEIGGERFEVDEATGNPSFTRLAGQTITNHRTYLRPRPRQFGRAVPLPLYWSWKDRAGISYKNEVIKPVEVRRRDDSDVSGPGEIRMQPDAMATSQAFPGSDPATPTPDYLSRLMAAQPPLKILFLAANPSNLTRLSIDQELRLIQREVFDKLPATRNVDVEYRGAIRASDLQGLLLRENPDIVHFSGHGSPNGAIYVEDPVGGSHPISSSALSDLFGLLKRNIRLVVLNACFSEAQANAIAEHIDCVIGMSNEIDDEAARAFSRALYLGICYNLDLETAFQMGCNAIDMENLEDVLVPKILAPRRPATDIKFFRN